VWYPVRLWLIVFLLLLTAGGASATANPSPHPTTDVAIARQQYADALVALERGKRSEYETLRAALDDYPLALYLDYFQLTRQLHKVSTTEASLFINRSADSPLQIRFLSAYLKQAGKSRRWRDFLAAMPTEPNTIDLKCYYFRAQLSAGDTAIAYDGAEGLWVHGKSQPKECDPLFNAWIKAGKLTDDIIWTRLLNTFDARQGSLMRYVAKKGSPQLLPRSDLLQAVYRSPQILLKQNLSSDSAYARDIASHGVAYLARYNPQQARSAWQGFQQKMQFSEEQSVAAESAIALQSLFARTEANIPWLEDTLGRLGDDKLVEIRLRWALAEEDWAALERTLPQLSDAAREDSAWRYWQAIVQHRNGDHETARQALAALATERSYYSFLAADKLGLAYNFDHQQILVDDSAPMIVLPAVERIEELKFHKEDPLAHSEWFNVLQNVSDVSRHEQLALLASQKKWYRMAIDAANRAKAWDALDQRFPTPYQGTFTSHALAVKVPRTELMAIARRESAFFPEARSPVGARGLMQIMPATGKQVASSIGKAHSNDALFEVEHNVHLGSTYYRQLLDRFGGNRVFALTAYNAGPHRVDRWQNDVDETVSVEVWVETIPYKETRNYVQAVLAYNVVFQYLMGDTHVLLTPEERQAQY
jgi:soluble lytic murein transglycosylase